MNNITYHNEHRSNYYAIRKYSVGTASILLGTFLIFGQHQQAQAAEHNKQAQTLEQYVDQSQVSLHKWDTDVQRDAQSIDKKIMNNDVVNTDKHLSVAHEHHNTPTYNDNKPEVSRPDNTLDNPANNVISTPSNTTQTTFPKQPVKSVEQSQASADKWLAPKKMYRESPQQENYTTAQMASTARDVVHSPATTINENIDTAVKGQEQVTKANFADHFRVIGNTSWYNPNTGIISLTDDTNNLVSAAYLTSKLDISQGFHLTGKVNLGHRSMAQNSGNGVSFILSPNSPGEIGKAGPAVGIGGLKNAFGFKLDTKFDGQESTFAKADPSYLNQLGAFGAFIHTTQDYQHKAITYNSKNGIEGPKLLRGKPDNNLFYPFSFEFNPKTEMLKVLYEGQTWERNIADWLRLSKTTKFNLTIFASTGPNGSNKQQFKFGSFTYLPTSTVYVQYKDVDTGENIARPNYLAGKAGDIISINHLQKDVSDDNYEFVMAEGPVKNNIITYTRENQNVILKYKMKKAVQPIDMNVNIEPQQPKVDTITTKSREITGTTDKNTEVKVVFSDGYTVHVQEDGTGRFTVIVPFGKRLTAGDTIQFLAKNKTGKISNTAQVRVIDPTVAKPQVKPSTQAPPQQSPEMKPNSLTSQQMDTKVMPKPSQPMPQMMDGGNQQSNQSNMKDDPVPMKPMKPMNPGDMMEPSQPMPQVMDEGNKQSNVKEKQTAPVPMKPMSPGDMMEPSQPMPQAMDEGNEQSNVKEKQTAPVPMKPMNPGDMMEPSQPMPQVMDEGNKQSNVKEKQTAPVPMKPMSPDNMMKPSQPMPQAMGGGNKQSKQSNMKAGQQSMSPQYKEVMAKQSQSTTQSNSATTTKWMADMPEKDTVMWKMDKPSSTTSEPAQHKPTMKKKMWNENSVQHTLPKTGINEGTTVTIFASFLAILGSVLLLVGRKGLVQREK
ncbi:lectin-like domain-containing protein [Staphylococcus arlettae]|uniref:lectin-like domain-containing protein n=1 Tax=Staphylococcus arlettae TaxID=29378 RepID=UPI001E4B2DE0|nr:YSIRK-type signal peptide-containing protein [Staphylococcus arlettae]MCD8817055.1 YSIRK-type signal peptide-containing protein [Staphylococcus arlettae]